MTRNEFHEKFFAGSNAVSLTAITRNVQEVL